MKFPLKLLNWIFDKTWYFIYLQNNSYYIQPVTKNQYLVLLHDGWEILDLHTKRSIYHQRNCTIIEMDTKSRTEAILETDKLNEIAVIMFN